MSMPKMMSASEACEYLFGENNAKNLNNLYQITKRFKGIHETMGHQDNGLCLCLLVEHKGKREGYYRQDKVKAYELYRRGHMTDIGRLITSARKMTKTQRPGITTGRPTNKVKR